jgi:gliding motility-associated-like protein
LKIKLLLLLLIFSINTYSQNQTNYWYFGDKSGLHFNNGNMEVLKNSAIDAPAGSSSISDAEGNLLFYTNGQTIWNKNHLIMDDGENLAGNIDNTQNSIIIPKPNTPNSYYIFTTIKEQTPAYSPGLYYSEIDISTTNPLGKVIVKNATLNNFISEKISAVHHADGESIWVIAYGHSNDSLKQKFFIVYKISKTGINLISIKQDIDDDKGPDISKGVLKVSPDGNKIALADFEGNFTYLYDFNKETGEISYDKWFATSPGIFIFVSTYGLAFSADSKMLYFSGDHGGNSYLYQYDIENQSRTEFSKSNIYKYRALQLTKNGTILVSKTKNTDEEYSFLDIIKTPEKIGFEANFVEDYLDISPGVPKSGLPNFIQSYFRNRIITENRCVSDTFNFDLDAYAPITAALWNFGDGSSASGTTTNHKYTTAGDYTVTCTITINGNNVTLYKALEVYPLPVVIPNQELIQCDPDNDGIDYFDLFDISNKVVSDTSNKDFIFYKTELNAINNIDPIIDPENFKNETPRQELFVKVISDKGCGNITNFFIESQFVALGTIDKMYTCGNSNLVSDGLTGLFNLANKRIEIRNQFSLPDSHQIRFYPTILEAQTTSNEITDEFKSRSTTIFVRVDSNLGCGGLEPLELEVNLEPIIDLVDTYVICYDPNVNPITLEADSSNDSFEWRDESNNIISTNRDFKLTTLGTFSLTVYKTENGITCANFKEFTVINPPSATFYNINVNTEDETNNIVDISLDGNSTYEFSLDNNTFFGNGTSHTFTHVTPGLRTIYIRDINNCEPPVQTDVSVIGYPNFFTPNNDNKNDYWNIKGLDAIFFKSIKIIIFDRYGKIVYQITDFNNLGWNGTYNGKPLPSNDYWFQASIIDNDNKIINAAGHFSLIRK